MVDLDDRDDVKVTYIGEDPGIDAILDAIEAEIESTTDYVVTGVTEDPADKWTFTAESGNRTRTYVFTDSAANAYRVAKVNWDFSHTNDNWDFEGPDYVPYAGGDVTGTLSHISAPPAKSYTIDTVSVTGAASATVKTAATFNGSELSEDIEFTIGACSADEITVTLKTVKESA